MNAKEMRQKLNEYKRCEGLDDWIVDVLYPCFLESAANTVAIPPHKIANQDWERRDFVHEMRKRGYFVQYKVMKQFDPEMCYISLPDEDTTNTPFEPTLPPGL